MWRQATEDKAQDAIAAVLRYGSILSALVMALGVVLLFYAGGATPPAQPLSIGTLILKTLEMDPLSITQLGILLLLLTPVCRVVIAVVTFGLERDLKYVLISSGVLLVVLASITFALW